MRFGTFELLIERRELLVDGQHAPLGPRAVDLLAMLVLHRARPVAKYELLDTVWKGLVVEENNLQVQISHLRRLLGAEAIATIPGRGYQFMLTVQTDEEAEPTPGAAPAAADGHDLPSRLVDLYGRDRDRLAVLGLLERSSVVSIVGPAGIGKTRLAVAIGQAWATGSTVRLVELSALNDARLLVHAIAQALQVTLPGLRDTLSECVDALRGEDLLLVIDNCEHLLDALGPMIARVAQTARRVRMLLTSQEPLRIAEETIYRLPPLPVPDSDAVADPMSYGSVRLFVERVRALQPDFSLTLATSAAAINICRRLDGLPLAIELAAARVAMLGVEGVRDRLGERLRLLTGGSRIAPRRHQTLKAAFDWSHGLLSPYERLVYRRLGVFVGPFSLQAAQKLVGDDEQDSMSVLDGLGSLVDKSLVIASTAAQPRYSMLESTREHALEQLAQSGETDALLSRHAAVTLCMLEQAVRLRRTDMLLADIGNIRSAFDWAMSRGDAETAVALATLPSMAIAVEGAVDEARNRLLEVEPLVERANLPDRMVGRYWQWYGRIGLDGRLPASRCIDAFSRAESIFTALGEQRHVHACRRHLAEALLDAGDIDAAMRTLELARSMEQQDWPLADRMRRLRVEGLCLFKQGHLEEALRRSTHALDLAQTGRIDRYDLVLQDDIARMHLEAGRIDDAVSRYERLAEQARTAQNAGLTLSSALAGLIASLTDSHPERAVVVAREALPVLRRSGIFIARADILAHLMARLGLFSLSLRLLAASDRFRRACETPRDPMEAHCHAQAIGLVRHARGTQMDHTLADIGTIDEQHLLIELASALG